MFPYRESTSCGTTVECSSELVGVRVGTNRYITILDGELREVIAMLINLASAKGLFSTPKESTPTMTAQSDLLNKIIVAAEDMIERLEACIADGNGELEDDRPAIADAKDAITQAKEALFPVAGTPEPEGNATDLRTLIDKIVETDEGNYTGSLAYGNWLAGVEFNPLVVAQLLEVAYLSGRHEAEQEHQERQQQRSEDALHNLYRRIWLYAPKAKT